MSANKLLEQLWLEKREIITSEELNEYGKSLYLNYSNNIIKYLISKGYLMRIFSNIFYVKSHKEFELNKTKYTPLELISKSLKLKKVHNWYYGLYTALTLNGMINNHEKEFYVINDKLFNYNSFKTGQYKLNFLVLKSRLLNFGIIKNTIRYSDPEKTILDFIYLWKINKKTDAKIIQKMSDYLRYASKEKIIGYSKHYPDSIRKILNNVILKFKTKIKRCNKIS